VIFLGVLTIGFTALLGMRSRWMHFALAAGLTTGMVVVVSADAYQQVLKDVKEE
jgi:hypothetical protein